MTEVIAIFVILFTAFDADIGWQLVQLRLIQKGVRPGSVEETLSCLMPPYRRIYRALRLPLRDRSDTPRILLRLLGLGVLRILFVNSLYIRFYLDVRRETTVVEHGLLIWSFASFVFFVSAGYLRNCEAPINERTDVNDRYR